MRYVGVQVLIVQLPLDDLLGLAPLVDGICADNIYPEWLLMFVTHFSGVPFTHRSWSCPPSSWSWRTRAPHRVRRTAAETGRCPAAVRPAKRSRSVRWTVAVGTAFIARCTICEGSTMKYEVRVFWFYLCGDRERHQSSPSLRKRRLTFQRGTVLTHYKHVFWRL